MARPAAAPPRHLPAQRDPDPAESRVETRWAAEPDRDEAWSPGTAPPADIAGLLERAERAGVTAIWTADYSATVELRRLAGPHDVLITHWRWGKPVGVGPWRLSSPAVRAAVYQRVLTDGSQFEIYRWVNLVDLARLWPVLDLPAGVRAEWTRALRAAGLPCTPAEAPTRRNGITPTGPPDC